MAWTAVARFLVYPLADEERRDDDAPQPDAPPRPQPQPSGGWPEGGRGGAGNAADVVRSLSRPVRPRPSPAGDHRGRRDHRGHPRARRLSEAAANEAQRQSPLPSAGAGFNPPPAPATFYWTALRAATGDRRKPRRPI